MLDRFYMPLLALAALAAIGLSLVWPQGLGDRSPAPFGHEPEQRTPAVRAAMQREAEAAQRRDAQTRATLREMQAQTVAPVQ
ncbi:hypothetical protein [Phenylobacterium immobile]|uniref:hypothetical protein n=1 Tax=Phenylobacterium immobile TaxID=21 RepID=UPI000AC56EA7|nr:hypothetical protein [Phenylobacterium immobile]